MQMCTTNIQAEGTSAAVNVGTRLYLGSLAQTDNSVALKASAFRLGQNLAKTLVITYSLLELDMG